MPTQEYYLKENRQSPRYAVRDSSALMLSPSYIISYSLLDISKSGLAFSYNSQGDQDKILKDTLATFFTDSAGTETISIQVICDKDLEEKTRSHQSNEIDKSPKPYLRRCSIKFNLLSLDQEEMIDRYIDKLPKDSYSSST